MPDYHKSKIYQIVSPSHPEVDPYYGSTTQALSSRMSAHKREYNAGKGTTAKLILCYDDAIILLVENYPCNDKSELLKREGEIISENKSCNEDIPSGLHVIDYQKSKIYKIYSPSHPEVDPYYGSTIQTLKTRMSGHKNKYINNNGGISKEIICFEDAVIELVENYPCASVEELNKREGWWILNNPCINKTIAGRTRTEWVIENKEVIKQKYKERYAKQKEANKLKKAEYKEKHKEEYREKRIEINKRKSELNKQKKENNDPKYIEQLVRKRKKAKEEYEKNKEPFKQRQAKYLETKKGKETIAKNYEKNRELVLHRAKEYYEKNKEAIKEYQKKRTEKLKASIASEVENWTIESEVENWNEIIKNYQTSDKFIRQKDFFKKHSIHMSLLGRKNFPSWFETTEFKIIKDTKHSNKLYIEFKSNPIQTHVSHPFDARSRTCKHNEDGTGCTCPTSRSQIVEDEDEKDEKSKHLEPAVEEKAAQASDGSRDLTETELSKKYLPELKEIAKNLDVKFPSKINKGELIQSILKKQAGK